MNDLNYTALCGFLAVVCAILAFGVASQPETKQSRHAFVYCVWAFIIFGSLTALTWGE